MRQTKYRDFVPSMLKERNGQKGEMQERRIYGSAAFVAEISKVYAESGETYCIKR